MRRVGRVVGNRNYCNLRGRIIHNKTISLTNCVNILPEKNDPIFKNAENVFLEFCDDNFVDYQLNTQRFPKARRIFFYRSNPSGKSTFREFKSNNPTFHLDASLVGFKYRWHGLDHVILLPKGEMELQLEKLKDEPLRITKQEDI